MGPYLATYPDIPDTDRVFDEAETRKIATWALVALVVAVSAAAGKLFNELLNEDIVFLIQDTEARDSALIAWSARQVLDTVRPTPSDVSQLNRDAGARHVARIRDRRLAEHLLQRFIALGLDIEARSLSGDWTALQMAVIDNDAAAARILIEHGARLEVRDEAGRDLRALAMQIQETLPDEDYRAVNALLQETSTERPTR